MVPPIVPQPVPPPGFYIAEEMKARFITLHDVALVLDMSEATIDGLLCGKVRITPRLAEGLGEMLDVSPDLFLNLQRAYDDQ
jgi:HTH-type transcriptional regulator/antitoxin HigA